jgi:hypothetical protein
VFEFLIWFCDRCAFDSTAFYMTDSLELHSR